MTAVAVTLLQAQPQQDSLQLVSSCCCENWAEEDGRCNQQDPTEEEHHNIKMVIHNHWSDAATFISKFLKLTKKAFMLNTKLGQMAMDLKMSLNI